MIASRQDVQQALRTIFGREPDDSALDCWTREVQRRNLSAVQLEILTLTRNEFGPQKQPTGETALDILELDEFVRRFVKAKEEQVSRLYRSADALSELGEEDWFHSFELSDGTLVRGSKTLDVLRAEFNAVFAPLALDGQRMLDVGAWNGAFSFEAKRLGAAHVLATDMYTWAHPFFRGFERFLYIRKDSGMDIDYKVLDTHQITRDTVGEFDVVLFLGVFYHLQDPITVIANIAEVATSWLIVETHLDLDDVANPAMRYYPGSELAEDPTNWWGPNQHCVEGLLRTAGFTEIHFSRNPLHPLRGIFHARRANGRGVGWRSIPSSVLAMADRDEASAVPAVMREANGSGVLGSLISRARVRLKRSGGLTPEEVATALYRGFLERDPDPVGLQDQIEALRSGKQLEQIVRAFVASQEFRSRILESLVPVTSLPALRATMPEMYQTQFVDGSPITVYVASADEDIARMCNLIEKHRYYDRFGAWTPIIDYDKVVTAAIVRGLGARSCFELGCFTGPVLSLLAETGISVLGTEVSHTAFALAYPNVRDNILFGDLLSLDIGQRFDVVLCMDALEHVSPLLLDAYIERIASLVDQDGYVYLNSPMWGQDHTFGVFEEPYLEEWRRVGDASYWGHWPCDDKGWPLHGHLVWASSTWWERKFHNYGLVRDMAIERAIHQELARFFKQAVGRRCLFVLRRASNRRSSAAIAAAVHTALANRGRVPRHAHAQS
jgi:2-polyprenyl-3-methyl-5-hydroxy-6-metoxy-1,4-benzoquinol methylase